MTALQSNPALTQSGADPAVGADPLVSSALETSRALSQAGAVYVGGPIDQVTSGHERAIARYVHDRDALVSMLAQAGFSVFAPHRAWSVDPGAARSSLTADALVIEAVNAAALANSAAMVALLPDGVPTIGTPIEIERMARSKRPVVVVAHRFSVAIEALAGVLQVGTVEHAVATMEAMRDRGELGPAGLPVPVPADPPTRPVADPAELPVRVLGEGGTLPWRQYADDAGVDLFVANEVAVPPHEFRDIESRIAVQIPPTHWGLITGRSSTVRKRGLLVINGVIDPGWRGDLFAGVWNLNDHTVTVSKGDRLAQLILLPNATAQYAPVLTDELQDHPRGTRGFGSTGGHENG